MENRMRKEHCPDASQQAAVFWREGPCAVIAGPGSGKTAVITGRVESLIESGVAPGNILTITFTKAAAREMQGRFLKRTGARFQEAAFGTFHSVFYNILTKSGRAGEIRLVGAPEKKRMMEQVLRERGLRFSGEITEALLRAVSRVKNLGISGTDGVMPFPDLPFAGRFFEVYEAYEELRRTLNRMDYDDIAPECLAFLKSCDGQRKRWQDRFRYIQIDEFQDVNPVQYELAAVLAGEARNLFVVGDDDQSIYGFRGATPDILQRFFRDYPDAGRITLQTNYRSSRAVVQASSGVIAGNRNRMRKRIVPSGSAECGICRYREYAERKEELRALSETIRERMREGVLPDSMAVLYRTATDAMRIADVLRQAGIPFRITERVPVPFTETCAEDVLAYLRFATGERDRSDFLRILNKPVRYLSRNCAGSETIREDAVLAYYDNAPSCQTKLRRLFLDCKRIAHLKPHLAIGYVLQAAGYERHLRKETDAEGYAKAQEVLRNLRDLAKEHTDIRSFLLRIEALRETAKNTANTGTGEKKSKNGVRMMTMHASKGLEFDTVFLPLLNEGNMPQIRAVTDAEIEEERRLLYVAMTRARNGLYLSLAARDGSKRLLRSRFLNGKGPLRF